MVATTPDPMAPETVPSLNGVDGIRLAMAMSDTHQLQVGEATVQLPPQARGIFPLIDGRNAVAALAERLEARGVEAEQFERVWRQTVEALAPFGLLTFSNPVV
ncbi:hypothetical protein [Acetobacter sp.]|uniref:hypothetical protein n=1 Tax=Acetobacter sp. TaxID=440 RepID=UPI0039ECDF94